MYLISNLRNNRVKRTLQWQNHLSLISGTTTQPGHLLVMGAGKTDERYTQRRTRNKSQQKHIQSQNAAHGHARGAESLVNWRWKHHLGRPEIFTEGAKAKFLLNGKTGIIFFKDFCFTRGGDIARRIRE